MNFFLDENFPKPAMEILVSKGHQVFDIRSTEFEGSDDTKIFALAHIDLTNFKSRVLLLKDKHYSFI